MTKILLALAVNAVVKRTNSWISWVGDYWTKSTDALFRLGLMAVIACGLGSLSKYLHSIKWWHLAQYLQHVFSTAAFRHVQESTIASSFKQKTCYK